MKQYLVLFFFLVSAGLFAQAIPDSPKPPRLVNDFANILTSEEVSNLEQKLISYEDSTSNQVSIVLVKSLGGYDVADYSVRLAEKWGIGSKKNNGILFLLSIEDRKSRIEVGYGLEGKITDAISKRILLEIKPYLKEGNYNEALNQATYLIAKAAAGEYQGEYQYSKNKKRKSKGMSWGFVLLILIILFLASRGNKNGRGGGGGFLTGMLLGQMLGGGRRSSGGWGDFSSGGGSFGGFGGGSFGGGGASGDW